MTGASPLANPQVPGFSDRITSSLGAAKYGFLGGVYATARLNPRFGIRLEALYAVRGTQGKFSGEIFVPNTFHINAVNGTSVLTLNYLEVPILAVVSFPTDTRSGIDLLAGPAIAFRTKAQLEQTIVVDPGPFLPVTVRSNSQIPVDLSSGSGSASVTQDVSDRTSDTDVGAVLGIRFWYRKGAAIISWDARWTQGLQSVDTSGLGAKNQSFSLSLALGVPVGGRE